MNQFILLILCGLSGVLFAEPLRVACVGDSITSGSGKSAYPVQLGALLGDAYHVKNFGVSGSTMLKKGNKPYWETKRFSQAKELKPNLVIIKLGTNDSKPVNWTHKADFQNNAVEMVQAFQNLPSKPRVIICLPVPVYRDKSDFSAKVMELEQTPMIEAVAYQTGCEIADLYHALSGQKELFPDGIHPNAGGAAVIAETLKEVITTPVEEAFTLDLPKDKVKMVNFHGYQAASYKQGDLSIKIAIPKRVAKGQPWIWRARFWDGNPQFDQAMLERGWHVCYCNVAGLLGAPSAVELWNKFHTYITEKGLSPYPVLEGHSRGGLIIHNWAAANPDKVGGIYGDNQVMDFKSWPGTENKKWGALLKHYGFANDEQAMAWKTNPVDSLAPLAKAKVPLFYVLGDADTVVPIAENGLLAAERYQKMGGPVKTIIRPGFGHHPHGLDNPKPLVNWALDCVK